MPDKQSIRLPLPCAARLASRTASCQVPITNLCLPRVSIIYQSLTRQMPKPARAAKYQKRARRNNAAKGAGTAVRVRISCHQFLCNTVGGLSKPVREFPAEAKLADLPKSIKVTINVCRAHEPHELVDAESMWSQITWETVRIVRTAAVQIPAVCRFDYEHEIEDVTTRFKELKSELEQRCENTELTISLYVTPRGFEETDY